MCELRSRVIINEWIELTMLWYANVLCERIELGGDDSKHSDRQWILRAISKAVSGSEHSYWGEVSGSAVSAHFERHESVCHLLFHVGMFYSVVIYIYPHISIFCSVVLCISLYRLFVRFILYFIYFPLKWGGGGSLKITYINPTYFFPIWSPFLQKINHPGIPYQ